MSLGGTTSFLVYTSIARKRIDVHKRSPRLLSEHVRCICRVPVQTTKGGQQLLAEEIRRFIALLPFHVTAQTGLD
jgi:hypothetical protein